jgi:hypothetical protein
MHRYAQHDISRALYKQQNQADRIGCLCTLSEVKLTIYFQSTKHTCSGVANGSLLFFLSPITLYNIVTQGEKFNIWGKFFLWQRIARDLYSFSYH